MKPFFTVERLKFGAIFYEQKEFERQMFRTENAFLFLPLDMENHWICSESPLADYFWALYFHDQP